MARDPEMQFSRLIANSMFSEGATFSDGGSQSFAARGIFYSGSYEEDSPAAYAPRKLVAKECFQISTLSVPTTVENPWDELKGWSVTLTQRNLKFRIIDISGKRGGMFTLYLQEVSNG